MAYAFRRLPRQSTDGAVMQLALRDLHPTLCVVHNADVIRWF